MASMMTTAGRADGMEGETALTGGCHCEAVSVEVRLAKAPGAYAGRACDCGFCTKHGAVYLSDPGGAMRVQGMAAAGRVYRQGSGSAEFALCGRCGVLVAVSYVEGGRRYGAVNVRVLEGGAGFAPAVTVSPQRLGAAEKKGRWVEVWFPDVVMEG